MLSPCLVRAYNAKMLSVSIPNGLSTVPVREPQGRDRQERAKMGMRMADFVADFTLNMQRYLTDSMYKCLLIK